MGVLQVREFTTTEDLMAHYRAINARKFKAPPPPSEESKHKPAVKDEAPTVPGECFAKRIVQRVLLDHPGVTEQEVRGERRLGNVVKARHACVLALVAELPRWTIFRIANYLGKDHSTILHVLRKQAVSHGRPCPIRTPLTKEQQEAVIVLHNSGELPPVIAATLRASQAAVRTFLHNTGLRLKQRRPDRSGLQAQIRALRDQGKLYREISVALGMCETQIKVHARRMGLPSYLSPRQIRAKPRPQSLSSGDPA